MALTDTIARSNRPVYGDYYGLREAPFDLAPDPRFLFLTPQHREAQATLRFGLTTPRGFTVLIGDVGAGKTTLANAAVEELKDTEHRCALLTHPTLERGEFYDFLARGFALSEAARHSKTQFLAELKPLLLGRASTGGITTLMVDEAQSLSLELLEEVRLLGNMETPGQKLLNVVLLGQTELGARLEQPEWRQLKQRVSLRCELTALSLSDTARYIAGRLRIAGGSAADIFTREAVIAIHEATRGVPRTINVLCDNTLISAYADQVTPVTAAIVEEVSHDFKLAATGS